MQRHHRAHPVLHRTGDETVEQLQCRFHADALDDSTWQVKLYFIGMLMNHKQPELAETFFNSVFCRILDRDYFNSDFISPAR